MMQTLQILVPVVLAIFLAVFGGMFVNNKRIDDFSGSLGKRMDDLTARMDDRFNALGKRMDDLIGAMNQQFANVNKRFDDQKDFIHSEIHRVEGRIERLEHPVVRR